MNNIPSMHTEYRQIGMETELKLREEERKRDADLALHQGKPSSTSRMAKIVKLLAAIGLCGTATWLLSGILNAFGVSSAFDLSIVATAGFILLLSCTVAILVCLSLRGYNPAERWRI